MSELGYSNDNNNKSKRKKEHKGDVLYKVKVESGGKADVAMERKRK